ncbi:hypothetical protein RJ640_005459 [Escallonia rubra]|uniref:Uncharacterized protein n=1 Tax=Escallonia rubra TaxID=112253 RepID=A0AA88UVJ9_9ASTE|nr:hypothetical protein RJ640_005459 [Escallonia rubra]
MFGNFTNSEGKLCAKQGEETRGLVGLYEAPQLSIEGEDVHEKAAYFSSQQLTVMMKFFDHNQARKQDPFERTLEGTLNSIYGYENTLQELANIEWWNDLDLANEMKLARHPPLKWHVRPVADLTDPSFSEQRIELTKPISLVYII